MKSGVKESPRAGLPKVWYLEVRNADSQIPLQSCLPLGVNL